MANINCPELADYLNEENCLENIGGTSAVAYYFVKGDLAAPLTLSGCIYSAPTFKSGKGLYKFDLKDETQQIKGESQGNNGGFNLTYNATIESVNKRIAELSRALNNLDICIIVPDGQTGDTQIMYDPNRRCEADNGGIAGDTGDTADSDRQATCEFHLKPVKYPLLYVTEPAQGGWDSLMVE